MLQDVAKCCKRRTPGVGDIQEVQVLQIRHSVTFSCRRYLDDDPSQQVQHGMETQWRHNESMCKWFQIKMKQISPKWQPFSSSFSESSDVHSFIVHVKLQSPLLSAENPSTKHSQIWLDVMSLTLMTSHGSPPSRAFGDFGADKICPWFAHGLLMFAPGRVRACPLDTSRTVIRWTIMQPLDKMVNFATLELQWVARSCTCSNMFPRKRFRLVQNMDLGCCSCRTWSSSPVCLTFSVLVSKRLVVWEWFKNTVVWEEFGNVLVLGSLFVVVFAGLCCAMMIVSGFECFTLMNSFKQCEARNWRSLTSRCCCWHMLRSATLKLYGHLVESASGFASTLRMNGCSSSCSS